MPSANWLKSVNQVFKSGAELSDPHIAGESIFVLCRSQRGLKSGMILPGYPRKRLWL